MKFHIHQQMDSKANPEALELALKSSQATKLNTIKSNLREIVKLRKKLQFKRRKPFKKFKRTRASKYRNVRTSVDGHMFMSKKEALRYAQLKMLEKAGVIKDLKMQVPYTLSGAWGDICKYYADFVYYDNEKKQVIVEDVKSAFTRKNPVYRLKKKMMYCLRCIDILET